MACKAILSDDNRLGNKRFASHAAVARSLQRGESCVVQETSGGHKGWYRSIKSEGGGVYTVSRPLMEY